MYYGSTSGSYLQSRGSGMNAGNATTYTVSGLLSGRAYYFAVTSVDAVGNESAFSNEASTA